MPRYLTPTKVCLLTLIELYTNGEVLPADRLKVLSFVSSQIVLPSEYDEEGVESRVKLATCGISVFADTLSKWSSVVVGRSLYDVLLQRLWQLDGLDALHIFFERINAKVTSPVLALQVEREVRVSRSSPLGQVMRRCSVEFTRLRFEDVKALWSAFVSFRATSYDAFAARNPALAARQTSVTATAWENFATIEIAPPHQISFEDTEFLLSYSIHGLQRLGTRVSGQMKANLEHWLEDQRESSTQSLRYFMAFFEHWRSGQYTMALESLHRYFDYSVGKTSGDNMKVYYQYALLHLSMLHADFDCWQQSIDAMRECIETGKLHLISPVLL